MRSKSFFSLSSFLQNTWTISQPRRFICVWMLYIMWHISGGKFGIGCHCSFPVLILLPVFNNLSVTLCALQVRKCAVFLETGSFFTELLHRAMWWNLQVSPYMHSWTIPCLSTSVFTDYQCPVYHLKCTYI